jgi:RHS repeat-associated protein
MFSLTWLRVRALSLISFKENAATFFKKKSPLLLLLIFFCSLPITFIAKTEAAEITTDPIKLYQFYGGSFGGRFTSISELLNNYNAASSLAFAKCKAGNPGYNCYFETRSAGGPIGTNDHGEPINFAINIIGYTEIRDRYTGEIRTLNNSGVGRADLIRSCPNGFIGPVDNDSYTCVKVEKKSCPTDGNPINIGTGEKFEQEIDFSTADDVLKIERVYVNQFANWTFNAPYKLAVVNPGGIAPLPMEYSSIITSYRYALDPNDPGRTETYTQIYGHQYANKLSQRVAYLTQGRERDRFIESSGVFVGDGGIGAKTSLVEINPDDFAGAQWKLTHENGDISFFLPDGSLQRTEFARGGSLSYQYVGNRLLSKTDHLGRNLTYGYDIDGRLTSITMPDAQVITYEYGQDKKAIDFALLKKVTWPNGESIGYIYGEPAYTGSSSNLNAALTGKIDSIGNRIGIYKYSADRAVSTEGALASFKRVMQHFTNYTIVTDGINSQRRYNFTNLSDGTRLVTSTNQPAGSGCAAATQSATYYTDGLKKTETNFNGHKTQFAYDATRALETVRVEGIPAGNNIDYLPANTTLVAGARKITTQWHSQHRKPIKKSEPKLITTFIYNGDADPFNNNQIANCAATSLPLLCHKVQQATTDSNGATGINATLDNTSAARHEFYTYNARGQQLTFARAATGTPDETREYYESTTTDWTLGDLKQITNALGHTTQFIRYDRNGRLLEMQDANNVETEFTYDARGRVVSQTIAGATTTHTYDLNGNRIGSVLPNGVTMIYHYDLAKRLIAVENSLGEKINYEYDVESNLRFERITDAGNAVTYTKQHVYDALSRVQNTLNSNNQGSTYLYDAKGNLTGEVDANTKTTSHTIDPLDRLTRTTDALTGKTDFSYDAQGNLTQVKDARNNATTYIYNAFGDLVSQTSPDTGTTTFVYDAKGNRTSSTDARSVVVNYSYDALNRLTSIQYPAAPTEDITYGYDAITNGNYGIGRLTSIVTSTTRLDFEYNPQGLITKKYAQAANTFVSTQYRYDAAGNLTGITYPSGREVNYALDTAGRISSITTKANATATAQTLVNNVGYLPFGPANTYHYGNNLTHTQTYDQDYRLTGIQVGGLLNRTYGYDPVNNITSIVNSLNNTNNQSFSYDALNRLITANGGYGNLGYGYDAVGNRLNETRNGTNDTYQYATTSNRLNGITRTSGNRNFTYDAAGNPIQRTADNNNTQTYSFNNANRLSSVSVNGIQAATYTYNPLGQRVLKTLANGTKEIYHYDESGQLLAVLDGTGATLREYIYWGNQQIALVNNGTAYYIHNDHLNTPQVITNQSQQVVWKGDYEPFGKVASNTTNSIEIFSRFPGQYLDGETGLYYNYFRDYDPSIGRYIESDPIGLEGGINTYAYVSGNPVKYVDPTGEIGQAAGGVAGGLAIPVTVGIGFGVVYCTFNPSHPSCQAARDVINRCLDNPDEEDEDKNCEALYQSTLRDCASLTGRKRMACFEAARINREQCYQERGR